ncbi:hypothetical protein [Alcaligenes sp. SDU_A2]|uniref:hypothetical protein n=1 Tax=Alcaligenes sp. SDU_A2 TaxID=3136634 RepID=UPI00311EFDBE
MKKIASIFTLILILIAAHALGNIGGSYAATSNKPSQHELLRRFVNEFIVNNANVHYPVQINEDTYLIDRSIKEEGRSMFVVENYRITAPVTANPNEIKQAKETTWRQVKDIFCTSLQERDRLFTGYSSVGIIQNIADSRGTLLFSVKVEKSQCS